MSSFYFKTFARLALLPYIGGTVIHILRLIYNLPIDKIPFEVDWLVVIIGGYAGMSVFKEMGQMFGLAKRVYCSSFSYYAACR